MFSRASTRWPGYFLSGFSWRRITAGAPVATLVRKGRSWSS